MACVLGACDVSGLTAAYQLRHVDPARTDATVLRVAVITPAALRPQRRAVFLTAELAPEDGTASTYRFSLIPAGHGAAEQRLAQTLRSEQVMHPYRIAPSDMARFQAFRAAMIHAQNSEGAGEGSLSVDAPLCRTTPALPDKIPVTILLDLAETPDYVRLFSVDDMLRDAGPGGMEHAVPVACV